VLRFLKFQDPYLVYCEIFEPEKFNPKANYENQRNTLLRKLKEINQATIGSRIFRRWDVKPPTKK
jgi:hypothetical protein